jgi:hypothetical protein
MSRVRIGVFLGLILPLLFSCTNPMVTYLLSDPEFPGKTVIIPVPVALWNNVWYMSLAEAVDAADDGTSASPSLIYIRRNINGAADMGGNGIVLASGKHIRLEPYQAEIPAAAIERWDTSGSLFTVLNGGSLTLGDSVSINGRGIYADAPLVKVNSLGEFFMDSGSRILSGRSTSPDGRGAGVWVEMGGVFTMTGGAVAGDTDVYLKTGAKITVRGVLGANPIARISPEVYPASSVPIVDVVDEAAPGDLAANNARFDVTPERVAGWGGPRHWRVNASGQLFHVVARRNVSGGMKYYETLGAAFAEASGNPAALDVITVLSNIDFNASANETASTGQYIRLTVPASCTYLIRRTASTTQNMFTVSTFAILEIGAPAGSALVIDGGAAWNNAPSSGGTNGGSITSTRALIDVNNDVVSPGTLRLTNGVVLRNNDRTSGNGGGLEIYGRFSMSGGTITANRTSGNGGGIFIGRDAISMNMRTISGGSISNNDAGLSGGGLMLDMQGYAKLTMSGGLISGNRANGRDPFTSVSLNGYGGGVFIPNHDFENEFNLTGGTISNNVSISGLGNGVAMDRKITPAFFRISGGVSLAGNDVLLHYTVYNDCVITVTGPLYNPVQIRINMDDYPSASGLANGRNVLAGNLDLSKFTVQAPYALGVSGTAGRIYRP